MADPQNRQFPQSLEAERALLGGLLLDNERVISIAELLAPDDFYREAHARLFELMLKRSQKHEPLDVLGAVDHLISTGNADDFGGIAYVSSLPEQVPVTENLEYYAHIVRDKAMRRRLLEAAYEIAEGAYGGIDDQSALMETAEKRIFEVAKEQRQQDWKELSVVLDGEVRRIEQVQALEGTMPGISTGWADMDRLLTGLHRTDLIVLAARPAMGKTSLALNLAQFIATRSTDPLTGNPLSVGIFSLEMGAGQLATRMLCAEARVNSEKVRKGELDETHDWPRLVEASETLYHAQLYIDDTPGLSITQVRSKARRLATRAKHPLGLVMIDYLQLMSADAGSRESREQQISAISRGLKHLAKELNVPVLALSQLNRGVESRPNKRPRMSDLRESGAIEQDADIIMFIYRDEVYNEDTEDRGTAEIIVAKHRGGPTGTVRLAFLGEYTRFENLARPEQFPGGYA